MAIKLLEKEGSISNSSVYVAYLLLKYIDRNVKKEGRISIYSLLKAMKDMHPESSAKQFMFALMFLRASGIIDFRPPYIEVKR